MSAFEQLALAGEALRRTLVGAFAPALWGPWLALGLLQGAVLAALVGFAHPLLAWALVPLVERVGGESALHYPDFFRALPVLYARVDLVVGGLAGAVAAGWSTWLFAARWRGGVVSPGAGWREAGPRALVLVVAQLPFQFLALGLNGFLGRLLAGHTGLVVLAGYLVGLAGVVVLQAFFLYLPARIVLERRGLAAAFASLPETWSRGFWAALLLGTVLALPLLPLDQLGRRVGLLVDRGIPELAIALTAAQLLVTLVVSFLLTGSATLVYLGAVAGREEKRS